MTASMQLGRLWGIPIGLHWSWFAVFGLVTWSLALGYFPLEYPTLPAAAYWGLGALTSLLLFGSVLLHELGHTWVALRNQVPVHQITLFIFGGVAHLTREPRTPGVELRIAIAGPATSFALAAVFSGLWLLDRHIPYLAAPSLWLARMNLIIALFNLIPGFPLDGGRVFRALLWRYLGTLPKATRLAAFTGQLAAFGFIGWGLLTIVSGNFLNGLWLVVIGWFLQNAAASSYEQSHAQQALHGVSVAQVMTRDYPKIPGHYALQKLVEEEVLTGGQRHFIVAAYGRKPGLLTLRDVMAVPRTLWNEVTAEQAMVPWERLIRVAPHTGLVEALQRMDDAGVAQVPVMEGETIVGMLSREQVLHYIRIRAELGELITQPA